MIFLNSRPASALLLSFFLMSILILVGMAVSILVLRDLGASRTMVSGVQAEYAAEGMTELGLLTLQENLPGYEVEGQEAVYLNEAGARLALVARSYDVPCEGQGEEWRALSQNESIQLPLFAQTAADGTVVDVDDFYIEFYVADEEGLVTMVPSTDVLRWKILGLNASGDTQAISEYIPLNGTHTSSGNPSVFGTNPELVDASAPTAYQYGKFYNASGYRSILNPYYSIATFLEGHSYNYLVLTNVVTRAQENTIYFRFHSQDEKAVCEYAQLATVGEGASGDTRQELNTLVKEGENLPVFDFVLYHTGEEDRTFTLAQPLVPVSSSWLPWSP